ncbi:MAG: PucR family transcriptional regulator ligand-binding domain-containing protein [Firmicutes bacterium]|nr:PucR family transcriptional regulator ligand-binding domain-containing protein [Bacillota bacterium]
MSVTVSDCLKLSALREAKVMAGYRGLNRIVSAVSVLEYADASLLSDELFLGDELIISALISIKDNIEAQCKLIRRLHEGGEVGLIIYYLGIFVPKLDEQLLKIADELDFPLICMPENRFDFRYSEAISEILGLIIKDQMKETYNVPLMYLVAANEQRPLPIYYLKQASQVISIFINNWQYDFKIEDTYALIHAILEDDPLRMRKIAKKLKVDVASIHTM